MDGEAVHSGVPRHTAELAVAAAGGAKLAEVGAAAVELLHPLVAAVPHPDIAAGVEGEGARGVKLAVAAAGVELRAAYAVIPGAEDHQERAAAVKLLHPGVAAFRHPDIAAGVDGEVARTPKLSIAGAGVGLRAAYAVIPGTEDLQERAGVVELLHPVVAVVRHPDIAAEVDG